MQKTCFKSKLLFLLVLIIDIKIVKIEDRFLELLDKFLQNSFFYFN